MKAIEQRAEEYVPNTITAHIFKSSPLKGLIVRILRDAYIAGATDQKEIDDDLLLKLKSSWEEEAQINHNDKSNYKQGYHDAIEKACEWFSDYLFEIGYPDDWKRDSENIISGERRFRKAMKKELWKRWKE